MRADFCSARFEMAPEKSGPKPFFPVVL